MSKEQGDRELQKEGEALAVLLTDLRFWVFKEATDAARYFYLSPSTITRYENGKTIPPLGYLACLGRLVDERFEQAGQLDSNRREKYLQRIRAAILNHYPEEKLFLDWNELLRVADDYMKKRWGENWPLELARTLQKSPLGNMPPRHEEYLGYEQEVKTISEWLASRDQLVVIEGIDGVGKTWLAIEVGNYCLTGSNKLFEAGVWISAKDHPEQKRWLEEVLNTVARQLRYPYLVHLPLEQRRTRINEHLRRSHTLIIIDNFDTIEDPNLEDWIRQVPEKSKVLITSRYTHPRLASDHTRSIRLGGLTTSRAIEFIRIFARNSGLPKLATALDEALLPLAEAAAGNPHIIRLALGEFRYTNDFNRAVENAMQKEKIWEGKWEILTEDAQQVLIVTPLFADSMSGEALGTAAGLTAGPLYKALEQLEKIQLLDVHESQLQKEVQIRYSIHPTVRSFATSKLKSQPAFEEQVKERWVTYFINFAKRYLLQGVLQERYWNALAGVGLTPIEQEWLNFKEVLRWSDEQGWDQVLVDLMMVLVHYMHGRALYSERIEYAGKAANAAQRLGQKVDEAYLRIDALSWILIMERRLEEAFEQIDTGLTIARSLDVAHNDANNLMMLAYAFRAKAYLEQGNTEKASEELTKVRADDCSLVIRSRVGGVAGDIALQERNYPKAIQFYKEALDAIQHVGIGYVSSSMHHRLGFAYLANGEVVQAEVAFNQLLSGYQPDITVERVISEYGLARVAGQKGEFSKAHTLAHQAHKQLSEMDFDHPQLKEIEEFLNSLSSRVP